ncbi:unnamed protein product, partial [Candidula unifasciata]
SLIMSFLLWFLPIYTVFILHFTFLTCSLLSRLSVSRVYPKYLTVFDFNSGVFTVQVGCIRHVHYWLSMGGAPTAMYER